MTPERSPRRGRLWLIVAFFGGGAALIWWPWPWLGLQLRPANGDSAVVVLAEDPRRTEAALDHWMAMQQGWLVLHAGSAALQRASSDQLRARQPSEEAMTRIRSLTCGCDTVGQITCLAENLRRWRRTPGGPSIGSVLLVTGQEHLPRALAIARLVLGADGLPVKGLAANTDGPPEDPLRTVRDRLRAQLWRATGWDGRPGFLSRQP